MQPTTWKIGALARRTGLSIRALHYYDEIGLLAPSHHTPAGHRLYTAADVERLQQIISLRALGFSLDEIAECLRRPDFSLLQAIELHLARLQATIAQQQRLCQQLEALAAGLRQREPLSAESFLDAIASMHLFERYFTPAQLAQIQARGQALGPERMRAAEAEWPQLIAQLRAALERGDDPAGAPVQALAARWQALVAEFTGGDPATAHALSSMYQREPQLAARFGLDERLWAYVTRALATVLPAPAERRT